MVMEEKYFKKAIRKSFKALKASTELANQNRDTEALIAIADRWILIADRLFNQEDDRSFGIGFISKENDVTVDQPGRKKAGDKRKS
jgi:hypothetical protein